MRQTAVPPSLCAPESADLKLPQLPKQHAVHTKEGVGLQHHSLYSVYQVAVWLQHYSQRSVHTKEGAGLHLYGTTSSQELKGRECGVVNDQEPKINIPKTNMSRSSLWI